MIAKLRVAFKSIVWACSPVRWIMRFAGIPSGYHKKKAPGLILIQIDGLSYRHLDNAMNIGRMPFFSKLLKEEHYRRLHHYSGIPSCTPSIQGELFYGVRQCVPAFKFRDHVSGNVFLFYRSEVAKEVERRIRRRHKGLLEQGSSYSNIFQGGAGENAHFCVGSVGWKSFFSALRPSALTFFFVLNFWSIARMFFWVVLEFFLAVYDSIAGTIRGMGFVDEIKFILSRLIVSIGLRESSVLGARLDILRGLPVIHVNFFGYDDQAHRRGPGSRFAYWALPGIDSAVRRIWRASQHSLGRDYEVWIYSDHGQEEVVPYAAENGIGIEKAVEKLFREMMPNENFCLAENGLETGGCRTGGYPPFLLEKEVDGRNRLYVTAQGPVGFIYPHRRLNDSEKERLAEALVCRIRVPLVLTRKGHAVFACSREGKFRLPEEAGAVLGPNHPYLDAVARELVELCRHPDAGAFVISGWRREGKSVSFPPEYGSHAGPGPEETDGFALLPPDIAVPSVPGALRPLVLRDAALKYLDGGKDVLVRRVDGGREKGSLRVMTYNVHSCIGMDGKLSPERIARVIARHAPDVVALQELDSGRIRTLGHDQARHIARLLDMEHHYHPVRAVGDEMFGNAFLSRYPMKVVRAAGMPRFWRHDYFEPRGALWVEIAMGKEKVHLINTHLSFWMHEQRKQAETLCGPEWLGHPSCSGHVILCGDFNALPYSGTCRTIRKKLDDVQLKIDSHKPLKTWFGHLPLGRIDHIFVSAGVRVRKVEVPGSRLEKISSDHLPLIADLEFAFCASARPPETAIPRKSPVRVH